MDFARLPVLNTLMKGDKVVKGIKQLSNFALFLKRREEYLSHTELVVIEVETNTTLLQLHNQLLEIRRFEPMPEESIIYIVRSLKDLIK